MKFKEHLHEIIFESDTSAGKIFDIGLLIAIIASVTVVMLDSVEELTAKYNDFLYFIEWFFTIIFTVEYILRIYAVRSSLHYIVSFYGLVDLLSILPTYISLFFYGSQFLVTIRILRILRVFRILKLTRFLLEADVLVTALRLSIPKITVFLGTITTISIIMGTLMYLIEDPSNGFTNIPRSIYWAIVTMTTVGYGDISPQSPLGQFFSVLLMLMGYGIIAVPTGIVSVELAEAQRKNSEVSGQSCPNCTYEGHVLEANYCHKCGSEL